MFTSLSTLYKVKIWEQQKVCVNRIMLALIKGRLHRHLTSSQQLPWVGVYWSCIHHPWSPCCGKDGAWQWGRLYQQEVVLVSCQHIHPQLKVVLLALESSLLSLICTVVDGIRLPATENLCATSVGLTFHCVTKPVISQLQMGYIQSCIFQDVKLWQCIGTRKMNIQQHLLLTKNQVMMRIYYDIVHQSERVSCACCLYWAFLNI